MSEDMVKVWVGVVIEKGNQVLLGRRFGKWCFPGGISNSGNLLKNVLKEKSKKKLV